MGISLLSLTSVNEDWYFLTIYFISVAAGPRMKPVLFLTLLLLSNHIFSLETLRNALVICIHHLIWGKHHPQLPVLRSP